MNKLRFHVSVLTTSLTAMLALTAGAHARPYTVVSCDSAGVFGYSTGAWVGVANTGRAYATCPSNGGLTAGLSNRMVDKTYSVLDHSGHYLTAPPGATITKIRWAGRMARANCTWATFIRALPSNSSVLGYRNRQLCDATDFDNRGWPLTLDTPAGTTRLDQLVMCGSDRCPPGATLHSQTIEVVIDDPVPPSVSVSGPLVSGRWVSARTGSLPRAAVSASDNAGIRVVQASLGTDINSETISCNFSQVRPCPTPTTRTVIPSIGGLADGRHRMQVTAVDAAGNATPTSRDVYVDNTPPDPVVPDVAGGVAWRRTNDFSVSWVTPASNAAPITRARWKICRTDGTCPWRGEQTRSPLSSLLGFAVPAPGDFRLHVWLEDAAGNQREAGAVASVPLRFDPDPPEVVFLTPDAADPLRVVLSATDRQSGLAGGDIEMRATGTRTWHGLRTERQGTQLVAYVDDERFRKGTYEFRGHAVDRAGNEASTGKRTDGSAASIRLPARIDTRLAVGMLRSRSRRTGPRFDADVLASFGARLRLTGLLTNADGQPIDGATIEAFGETGNFAIGLATTRTNGRFRYVLRASRNRDLVFRYGGSRRIGAATARVRLRVRAASSIQASRLRLRNGQQVTFTGRVRSRPLPATGKLIEIQAYFRGRWRTISTVRTNRSGHWRFPYRFGATLGRVTYRFRAQLPVEGGYPFAPGHSRVAKVVVIGP
jgi:hypothetical protein